MLKVCHGNQKNPIDEAIRHPVKKFRSQKDNGYKLCYDISNKETEFTEVGSLRGANLTTFSISRALALMASDRRALKSASGVSFGSMLAAATSSVSATDAAVFSWQAKG